MHHLTGMKKFASPQSVSMLARSDHAPGDFARHTRRSRELGDTVVTSRIHNHENNKHAADSSCYDATGVNHEVCFTEEDKLT